MDGCAVQAGPAWVQGRYRWSTNRRRGRGQTRRPSLRHSSPVRLIMRSPAGATRVVTQVMRVIVSESWV